MLYYVCMYMCVCYVTCLHIRTHIYIVLSITEINNQKYQAYKKIVLTVLA